MTDLLESPARPAFANFVAGEWRAGAGGETYVKRSPLGPMDVLGEFPSSDGSDVEVAAAAAESAFGAWSGGGPAKRAAVLTGAAEAVERRAEQIAHDLTVEMGKPIREARMEVARAAHILRFFAGETFRPRGEVYEQAATGAALYTVRRPLGVVGLITPWNFPIAIPAWKLAPALAYGNTVVLKPAQEAPLTTLHLASCLHDAGIPPGVCNVVVGRGGAVGGPLVAHPAVQAILFTGSVAVGERLRADAGASGKRAQLELGGQNPLIVMADADLDRAVEACYAGAYWSAGQKCTSTRRIYVQDAVHDAFRERLLERMARGVVGDPLDPATEVGPLVNEGQVDEVLAGIARGRDEGGTVLTGGDRRGDSFVVEPTLFEGVADDAFLSCEEVFGPVASLYRFVDLDEALARANAVRFGLSASIFTRDAAAVDA